MKWCCMGFQAHVLAAGSRGSGIFVSTRDTSEPAFILQFRALEPGAAVPQTESPLSSITDLQIQFCPWCGANLKKVYGDAYKDLDRSYLQV